MSLSKPIGGLPEGSSQPEKLVPTTGYAFCPSEEHRSPWCLYHPETPERSLRINRHLMLELYPRVNFITDDEDINSDLIKECHSDDYCDLLKGLCERQTEEEATLYDSVYFTKRSYSAVLKSLSKVLAVTKRVAEGTMKNAFANVRPPGHHASDQPNGYCLVNNVAVAARYLKQKKLAEKVLIVDYDVHHGQGTQRAFYDDNSVLYFSMHRYELGQFWPNLKEGSFEFVGGPSARGYNINVPLNVTKLSDMDYLAVVTQLLLPVAYEFNPDMILFSSGYDSCMGDEKGQMEVSPAFYAHLITLLGALANGKMVVVLEGGYCFSSLRDASLATVKALLNDPCPPLQYKTHLHDSIIESINNVKVALRPYWQCFSLMEPIVNLTDVTNYDKYNNHMAVARYIGEEPTPPFPIRNFPVEYNIYTQAAYIAKLRAIRKANESDQRNLVAYSYSTANSDIVQIVNKLTDFGLLEVMKKIALEKPDGSGESSHSADEGQISTENQKLTLGLLREIKSKTATHGFGFFGDSGGDPTSLLLMAMEYAFYRLDFKRLLILNFDVNFRDELQTRTYKRDDIMVISVHKELDKDTLPGWAGSFNHFGLGKAAGFNVNIPLCETSMSNSDYLMIWLKLVLPISYAFNPELILVSTGFGTENNLDPEAFGHLIQLIKPIAPMLLMYMGSNNVEYTSSAIAGCAKALLGLPVPMVTFEPPKRATAEIVATCLGIFKHYWPILRVNKALHPVILSQEELELALSHLGVANICM